MEFVADPGTAWCGDWGVFDEIVHAVKLAGGTAIKPQIWPKSFYKGHKMEKEALKAHITKDDLRRMTEICVHHELSMFCSVFSIQSFQMVMSVAADYPPMGERVKISCGKNKDWELIEEVLGWDIPEVLISVATDDDIIELTRRNVFSRQSSVKLLYCVPKYPTELKDVLFPSGLGQASWGFSDHTLGKLAPTTAAALGYDLIEKHVMLRKAEYLNHLDKVPRFPDEVCASTMLQFRSMVSSCKAARRMAGYD